MGLVGERAEQVSAPWHHAIREATGRYHAYVDVWLGKDEHGRWGRLGWKLYSTSALFPPIPFTDQHAAISMRDALLSGHGRDYEMARMVLKEEYGVTLA